MHDGVERAAGNTVLGGGSGSGVSSRPSEPVREQQVRTQYEDHAAAADYARSYLDDSPAARYFQSRLHVLIDILRRCGGGDFLDVGCGPGMLVRRVLQERPGDFRITALDMSPAMIMAAGAGLAATDPVNLAVGRAESLPLPDASFDVVVAAGVFEYCDLPDALDELARVTRAGGLVLVSMLNPFSLYRLFEWCVYWPLTRLVGRAEALLGRPPGRRHGAVRTGIRTVPPGRLRRLMTERGMPADEVVYYDLNLLLPPIDRVVRRWRRGWRERPETTSGRGGLRRFMGTGYLVAAHRNPTAHGEAGLGC